MEEKNNVLFIRKFPLGFIQNEIEKIDSSVLPILKSTEDKTIKLYELDRKLSENYYTNKFFNMMCNGNSVTIQSLMGLSWLPKKLAKMTDAYLECEEKREKDNVGEIMVYEFKRRYKK